MEICSQNTHTYTTIETYLRGCVGFEVTDEALAVILSDREVLSGTDICDLEKRTKELCKADLFMWCAASPRKTGVRKDADGYWSHEEGGTEVTDADKSSLRALAKEIYNRYGENVNSSSIKMTSRGMSVWRRR